MSPTLLILASMIVGADPSFEGVKAGDAKELVPGCKFLWCPAGEFTMGSPKSEEWRDKNDDQVVVTLTLGFWLGETEITQGEWQKLMGTTPWKGQLNVKDGDDYAATYISHDDAVALCDKLTKQERNSGRLPKGWKYSLPTEAQWEYACRAETISHYSFGDDESKLSDYGWWGGYSENGNAKSEKYAHRVGKKKPNAWGLKDMHGNVWEWCSDWYGEKLGGGRDPVGPNTGSSRVSRGGGWNSKAVYCRSAFRGSLSSDLRYHFLGCRLAAVPSIE